MSFIPYDDRYIPENSPTQCAEDFYEVMKKRRSVRHFSDRPVERETIEWLVRTACSAPSGANRQPWRFVCVRDPAVKKKIRLGAEAEEQKFYEERASDRWLEDLEKFGTGPEKPYIETAPWLIVVFRLIRGDSDEQVYYTRESVGLATGMFLAAAQHAGLSTLTHTPSPMKFLSETLERPDHEKPYLLIPVGWPAEDCEVPASASKRRPFEESAIFI